jgi:hypothetical protein
LIALSGHLEDSLGEDVVGYLEAGGARHGVLSFRDARKELRQASQ